MNDGVLVLSRDQGLIQEMSLKLNDQQAVTSCHSLETLRQQLQVRQYRAVFVHLDRTTLNGYSAGRFIAELVSAVEHAPVYGLLDQNCPDRLRLLADKSIDRCVALPLEDGLLSNLLVDRPSLMEELEAFKRNVPHKELHGRTRSLVTFTPEMFDMIDEIKVAAKHSVTSLLIGETGCGKTFLAKLIHELSSQREERFCTVACGALPPDLIESELFGYVKGAFTGADRDREGKFASAGKGTLLLDEIDVLPTEQQAKLLRVIETGEFEPVGSNETQISQARLIIASNFNLEDLVRAGTFRTDLYYRLNILCLRLLPLRFRPWDIEFLARKFAFEHSRTHGIPLRSIDPEFLDALRRYPWPGNVREMENVVRRAVLYCQRGTLALRDLPGSIRTAVSQQTWSGTTQPPVEVAGRGAAPTLVAALADRKPIVGHTNGHAHLFPPTRLDGSGRLDANGHANGSPGGHLPLGGKGQMSPGEPVSYHLASHALGEPATLEARVDMLECQIIEASLQRNNHRRKETAAELGISRVTLYNKMKKFGLL